MEIHLLQIGHASSNGGFSCQLCQLFPLLLDLFATQFLFFVSKGPVFLGAVLTSSKSSAAETKAFTSSQAGSAMGNGFPKNDLVG